MPAAATLPRPPTPSVGCSNLRAQRLPKDSDRRRQTTAYPPKSAPHVSASSKPPVPSRRSRKSTAAPRSSAKTLPLKRRALLLHRHLRRLRPPRRLRLSSPRCPHLRPRPRRLSPPRLLRQHRLLRHLLQRHLLQRLQRSHFPRLPPVPCRHAPCLVRHDPINRRMSGATTARPQPPTGPRPPGVSKAHRSISARRGPTISGHSAMIGAHPRVATTVRVRTLRRPAATRCVTRRWHPSLRRGRVLAVQRVPVALPVLATVRRHLPRRRKSSAPHARHRAPAARRSTGAPRKTTATDATRVPARR